MNLMVGDSYSEQQSNSATMTVDQHLVNFLEKRQTEHIFGLCGHTNIAVLSALKESTVNFINVRHEQIAAHAADGYARVKKRAGVLLLHLSPGLTNGATGVANAALDCIPLVVIAGDVPSHYYGKHPHQEINLHADASQYEIYRPFVKRAWRVDRADLFGEILAKAFQLAESGQPGPVLINVPMDIFSAKVAPETFYRLGGGNVNLAKPTLSGETARKIVSRLATADKPILHVGGGILLADAAAELQLFVDHMQIPVSHSLMGKGALPDNHPLLLGMTGFWGTSLVNKHCSSADLICAIGTRFKETDCSSWYDGYTFSIPATELIHIDIEPSEIGRNYPVQLGVVADAREALKVLNKVAREIYPKGCQRQEIKAEISRFRRENAQQQQARSDAFPMMPERILADVRSCLPADAILTTDVGWNKNGVGQQFNIFTPGSILTPGGFATMGFGPAAAIGAKLAAPERIVLSLVGDGGFGQNPAVLATAVEQQAAVIWLVMNNNAYGTIAGLQKAHYGVTYGTTFPGSAAQPKFGPDYAAVARAYGAEGIKITAADQLIPALQQAIAAQVPFLIDVAMINNPTPTTGHWNILDIYSPGEKISHVAT